MNIKPLFSFLRKCYCKETPKNMKLRCLVIIAIIIIFPQVINGQVVPPPVPPPPPPGLPINGGILFLIISALIYGVKEIKSSS